MMMTMMIQIPPIIKVRDNLFLNLIVEPNTDLIPVTNIILTNVLNVATLESNQPGMNSEDKSEFTTYISPSRTKN